jgi:hypothetical protein
MHNDAVTSDQAVELLARALFAYEAGSRTTREVTSDLTRLIVQWAIDQGWAARTEARIQLPVGAGERLGIVDVLIVRGDGEQGLAIEIDSADKPWSVDKLRYAAAAGMRPVWVRWGDDDWAVKHSDVDVIQLPGSRRPARKAGTAQLGFWP